MVKDYKFLDQLRQAKEQRFQKGKKKRVALGVRVSTSKQKKDDANKPQKDNIPIPVQREALLEWINSNPNWEPAMVNGKILEYVEVKSAYKMTRSQREVLKKIISDADKDLYDVIVFFKHDRVSRIGNEYTGILQDLWDRGIEPWDYEKKQCLKMQTAPDRIVRSIEGELAQSESENTSFRVTEHMKSYAAEGLWMGGVQPYGYKYKEITSEHLMDLQTGKKKKLRIGIEKNPEEEEIVRRIIELAATGHGSSKICRIINNPPYNYRKRNGKPFDHATVLNIVKNPICIGKPAWGKTSTQKRYFKRLPPEEWVLPEVPVESLRIVEDSVYEEAIRQIEERKTQVLKGKIISHRSLAAERLLSGIAFCGYCGEPLLSHTYANGEYKLEGYICRSKKRKSLCSSKHSFIRASVLDRLIIDSVSSLFSEKFFEKDLVKKKVKETYLKATQQNSLEVARLKSSINKLEKLKKHYIGQYNLAITGEKTTIPESIISEQLDDIQDQLQEALSRLNSIIIVQPHLAPFDERQLEPIIDELLNWDTAFRTVPVETQKYMLKQITDSITVYDTEVVIQYNLNINHMLNSISPEVASVVPGVDMRIVKHISYIYTNKARSLGIEYWQKVQEWEKRKGLPFGEIIANMRRTKTPQQIIEELGVSRGFLYYNFGEYMDRIKYIENKEGKKIREVIIEKKENGMTMKEISEDLGLSISCLYHNLKHKN